MLVCAHFDLFPPRSPNRRKVAVAAFGLPRRERSLLVSAVISGSPSRAVSCNKFIPQRPANCKPDITTGPCATSHPEAIEPNRITAQTEVNISARPSFSFERKSWIFRPHFVQVVDPNPQVISSQRQPVPAITASRNGLRDGYIRQNATQCPVLGHRINRIARHGPLRCASLGRAHRVDGRGLFSR